MASSPIQQPLGTSRNWYSVIRDSTGAVVTSYTLSNALEAQIWAGQTQVPLVDLSPTWVDPDAGSVKIPITETHLADLPGVGQYGLQGWVVDNFGNRFLFLDRKLEVTPSPGVATALSTDITWNDLVLYVPQILELQNYVTDLAQFQSERNEAQSWFREQELNRFRPQPGRSRRYLNAAGTASGPYLMYSDTGPAGASPPSLADVQGYFEAGGMVISETVKRCQAYYAASIVYLSTPGLANVYRQQGSSLRDGANQAFQQANIEIDTDDPPGDPLVPKIRIDRDITWLT